MIAEIDNVDYFSLSDDVGDSGNCSTDHSTVILSIELRGNKKTFNHDLGCTGTADLEKLVKLENKIDEIVGTRKWIR